jgi:hypothetical protein
VVGSHDGKVKSKVTSAARLREEYQYLAVHLQLESRATHVDMVTTGQGVSLTHTHNRL